MSFYTAKVSALAKSGAASLNIPCCDIRVSYTLVYLSGLWPAGSVGLFLLLVALLLAGLCMEVLDVHSHLKNQSEYVRFRDFCREL